MFTKKLSLMPYAQAHVEFNEKGIYLISYTTRVCAIEDGCWLTCTGTYSQTTRKHIGAFMKEYVKFPNGTVGNYYLAKQCYTDNIAFNIQTGEVKHLSY